MTAVNTHTISAKDKALGRIASEAAFLLMGKHKPSFQSHIDNGDTVIITDIAGMKFTGDKMEQKKYYRPTTRVGALRSDSLRTLWEKDPCKVFRKAVYGMLPKNKLRPRMIKRLKFKKEDAV